jgi:hypothetical protein
MPATEAAMKSRLLRCVAVASSLGVLAQTPVQPLRADGIASTPPAASSVPTSTTLSMRGTMDKYDASTRILSLSTTNGTVQFQLVPTTRIRQGSHTRAALELEKLTGYVVTVRYCESAASRILESVHIFGPER